MKKLTCVSYKVWIIVFVVIVLLCITTFLILKVKVESKIETSIQVSGYGKQTALIDDASAYKINVGNVVTFRINETFHYGKIESITYDDSKNKFLVEISGLNIDLLPGSKLPAVIIYDSHKVIDTLLGSV